MYWACAQLEPHREALALHCLQHLGGFETYCPRLREQRRRHGRKIITTPLLFPGYLFVWVVRGWWDARWSAGVGRLIMDGEQPARVPDAVIAEIKSRERGGLVVLPERRMARGTSVKILRGPFEGRPAIYADTKPQERVEILLSLLGSKIRVTLPRGDVVEAAR